MIVLFALSAASSTCFAGIGGIYNPHMTCAHARPHIAAKARPVALKPHTEISETPPAHPRSHPEITEASAAAPGAVTQLTVGLTIRGELVATITQNVVVRSDQVRFSSVVVERRLPLQI